MCALGFGFWPLSPSLYLSFSPSTSHSSSLPLSSLRSLFSIDALRSPSNVHSFSRCVFCSTFAVFYSSVPVFPVFNVMKDANCESFSAHFHMAASFFFYIFSLQFIFVFLFHFWMLFTPLILPFAFTHSMERKKNIHSFLASTWQNNTFPAQILCKHFYSFAGRWLVHIFFHSCLSYSTFFPA